jgi:hypothetical protein
VYAQFLGGIDGLPPLPEDFWPRLSQQDVDLGPPPQRANDAEKKLRIAFGEDERILKCPLKLEVRAKGIVLAAETFQVHDGGVTLEPFFIAIFGKEKEPGKPVEINTIRSGEAHLTFDRPINGIAEMGNRHIVGATLKKDIQIVNNRGTPQRDDDISLLTQGPLEYDEGRHHIWTDQVVRILDPSTKPDPISITAKGADVYLTVDAPKEGPNVPSAAKRKTDTITGVERLGLRSDVDMSLSVDARSGFMGGAPEPTAGKAEARPRSDAAAAKPDPRATKAPENKQASSSTDAQKALPPQKARVFIQTQGPFDYDMRTDFAVFEISKNPNPSPNNVVVRRVNEAEGKLEQLVCDRLEIQFRRKNAAAGRAPKDDRSVDLEIETAHATGANVTLTSDSENLNAFGNDLRYEAVTRISILKGEPEMWAAKDGNFIHAREMRMRNDEKGQQHATARGPGRIELLDRTTGRRPLLAYWRDELVYGREGAYDLLALSGEAVFESARTCGSGTPTGWSCGSATPTRPRRPRPRRPERRQTRHPPRARTSRTPRRMLPPPPRSRRLPST